MVEKIRKKVALVRKMWHCGRVTILKRLYNVLYPQTTAVFQNSNKLKTHSAELTRHQNS
jgi:hypothetical protein